MSVLDDLTKGWSRKKNENNRKDEEEKHDTQLDVNQVEISYDDGSELLNGEEKDNSGSKFPEDSLLEEDGDECQENDEIFVMSADTSTNLDAGVSRELDMLKWHIEGMSTKLDVVMNAIGNIGKSNPNGSRMADAIMSKLNTLSEQQKTLDNQQEIIKRQHDSIQKFNDDVIYKVQKGLILEMISIADQVRMIIENKQEDESYDLMQGLRELEESIEASLSNNSVRRYSEIDNDDTVLNRRRQTAIGNDITSDPAKDGHFKSVAPGYEWTMPYLVVNSEVKLGKILEENQRPQTFSFVIRPEEVMKLKYKAPKQSPNHVQETVVGEGGQEKSEDRCIEFE